MDEKFKAIIPSTQNIVSIPLKPESIVPQKVTPDMIKSISEKIAKSFFIGTTWSTSVDMDFDSFIIPHLDVITNVEVGINELTLDDGTKKSLNLETKS
jgi:hypothetical protein